MFRFLGAIFSFLTLAALAFAIGIASIFWWYSRNLPETADLVNYHPQTLTRVYASDGSVLAEYAREKRLFMPVAEMPELVKNAFIAAEDQNFYTHSGIDYFAIAKAMVRNVRNFMDGRRPHGASGITQQVAKNFLLSGEQSIDRKITEALLAQRLEKVLSKERILELYLNEINFGAGAYGVANAGLVYFGKSLEELTIEEVAYLAALPKAPNNYHPVRQREAAIERRNYVIGRMLEDKYITPVQAEAARAKPLTTLLERPKDQLVYEQAGIGYFGEQIRRDLIAQYGEDRIYGGGLSVRATIVPSFQELAAKYLRDALENYDRQKGFAGPIGRVDPAILTNPERWRKALVELKVPRDIPGWRVAVVMAVQDDLVRIGVEGVSGDPGVIPFKDFAAWAKKRLDDDRYGPKPKKPADVLAVGDVIYVRPSGVAGEWSLRQIPEVQGAVTVMDPTTGRVLAMQGGFSYQASSFNRAVQAQRQPGSSFKPFVYAAALERGYTPATIVLDAPVVIDQGGDLGLWKPKNYSDRFYGPSPMRLGLEYSRNLMTVRIAQDVGMEAVADYAERFGVYDKMPAHLSYSLGAGETTLLKMTTAYAIFVNGGKLVRPTLVDRIQDHLGRTVMRADNRDCDECNNVDWRQQPMPDVPDKWVRALDPVTAYQIVSMLEGVTLRGTANKLKLLGFPTAGKTGTTNDAKDAWFIGFTPDLVLGCYIGYDNPRSLGEEASGGALCAPVFEGFMREAKKGKPPLPFIAPPGVEFARIDRVSGRRVDDAAVGPNVIVEAFRAGTVPAFGYVARGRNAFGGEGLLPTGLVDESEIAKPGELAPPPTNIGIGSGGLY